MVRISNEAMWEETGLEVLADLGWTVLTGEDIAPYKQERESWADPIIQPRLAKALVRLNPTVPTTYLQQAQAEILRPRSADAITENFRLHQAMTAGYRELSYLDTDGVEQTPTIRLISPRVEDNEWLAVNQVRLQDSEHHRRLDIALYCNGLLVAVIELKDAGNERTSSAGAHAQLATYVREFPLAFRSVLLTVASDGVTALYGTPFTGLDHFSPWNVDDDGAVIRPGERVDYDDEYASPLAILLRGLFNQERFGQLLRGYTAFASSKESGLVKRIAKPHQYFAVTKAVGSTVEATRGDGRAGVVWHTQGSGKSMEMELYAAAIHREPALGNPTLIVITDRKELDGQLFDTFEASTLVPEKPVRITSRAQLREALTGRATGGLFFTTLQKFGLTRDERQAGQRHPLLTDRRNVLVIVDEAHRSHYDDLDGYAAHLHDALPHASFIAFTGTPISFAERNTRQVFGDYVDVYDLSRAVEDGATVPVYFEPRHITMARAEGVTDEDIDAAADEATLDLDDIERRRIEAAVARINEVYGHPDRIRALATDLLAHWSQRKATMRTTIEVDGKAMIVCATREIAARLYDEIVRQRREAGDDTWHSDALDGGKIKVVYSGSITDTEPISRHVRKEHEQKTVKARVKKAEDPLELVIVKDMMLTGFDAPCLHTLYVDRPLKGALLMQTLARVNRTFRGKDNGLLVGYAPLTESLEQALAEYSDTDKATKPQGRGSHEQVALALELLASLDGLVPFDWHARLAADSSHRAFLNVALAAVEELLAPDARRTADALPTTRRTDGPSRAEFDDEPDAPVPPLVRYRKLAAQLNRGWSIGGGSEVLVERDLDFRFHSNVRVMLAKLDAENRAAEGRPVSEDVERLLRSLIAETTGSGEVIDIYAAAGIERPDLARLTPEALEAIRKVERPHMAIEALRAALRADADAVTGGNIARERQFSQRLAELRNRYLNSQLTAAEIIEELIRMAKDIAAEARRGEQFDPPLGRRELATYDALASNESADLIMGQDTLARIARELVEVVRRDVKTDWTVREDVRAKLRASIKRLLVKYDYPPDQQQDAISRVIEQMELFAAKEAA